MPIRISRGDIAGRLIRFFRGKGSYPMLLDETAVPVVIVHDLVRDSELGETVSTEGVRWSRSVTRSGDVAMHSTAGVLNPEGSSVIIEIERIACVPFVVTSAMDVNLQVGSTADVIAAAMALFAQNTGVRTNLSGIPPDSTTQPFASVGQVFTGRAGTFPLGADIETLRTLNDTGPGPHPYAAPPLILPPGWAAIVQSVEFDRDLRFHFLWKEYSL